MSKLQKEEIIRFNEDNKSAIEQMLDKGKALLVGVDNRGGVQMTEVPKGSTFDDVTKIIDQENCNQPASLFADQFESTVDQGLDIYEDEFTRGKSSAPYFIRDDSFKECIVVKEPEIRINEKKAITNFTGTVAMPLFGSTMNMVGANNSISGLDEKGFPKNMSRDTSIINTRVIMNNFYNTSTTLLNSLAGTIMKTLKDMLLKKFGSTSNSNIEYIFNKNMYWEFEKGGIRSILCNLRNYVDSSQWAYFSQEPRCESIVNNNTINQIAALYLNNVINYVVNSKWQTKDEEYDIYDNFIAAVSFEYERDIQSFILETFHELARHAMVHISIISSINGVLPMRNPLPGINDKEWKAMGPIIRDMDFEF